MGIYNWSFEKIIDSYKNLKVSCSEKKHIWNGSNYGDESLPQDDYNTYSKV